MSGDRPAAPDRREFLRRCAGGAAAAAFAGCALDGRARPAAEPAMRSDPDARMPVLFVGHGSPMNAIEDNAWSRAFAALARAVPRPRAVLAISAHWCTDGTWLTASAQPLTIHDFGGFPQELFEVEYPAPGHPDLAQRVQRMLAARGAGLSTDWGLDHGTWSVLRRMYPDASVPVVQLSIDARLEPAEHLELARSLAPLRGDGVLVLGSGNITHNLRDAFARSQHGDASVPPWAQGFDDAVAQTLQARDDRRLAALVATPDGRLSHPYPDHWWPLLYAYGASDRGDAAAFPITGFDLGSVSMRAVQFG
jgi:4,5-DOPA dioxygenase extradiol